MPWANTAGEIPEGGGLLGVDPLESAKRELLEETGLKAAKWTELLQLHLSNSVSDELCIIYMAQNLQQFEAEPEDTEQLIIKKVPFAELYRMVCDGEVTDSVTVAAVLKIRVMQLEGKAVGLTPALSKGEGSKNHRTQKIIFESAVITGHSLYQKRTY